MEPVSSFDGRPLEFNNEQKIALAALAGFTGVLQGAAIAGVATAITSLATTSLSAATSAMASSLPGCPYGPPGATVGPAYDSKFNLVIQCSHQPPHCWTWNGGSAQVCP